MPKNHQVREKRMNKGLCCLALGLTSLLTACFDSDLFSRFSEVPDTIPQNINFYDEVNGANIGGKIVILPAEDESNIARYIARWGINGEVAPADSGLFWNGSNFIGDVSRERDNLEINVPYNTVIPDGINSIVVTSKNSLGETQYGASIAILNNLENSDAPTAIVSEAPTFVDTLNNSGISGLFYFKKVADEEQENVTRYVLRFTAGSCPMSNVPVIAEVKAGDTSKMFGSLYQAELRGVAVPRAATSITVIPANDAGESRPACNKLKVLALPWNKVGGGAWAYYPPKIISFSDTDDTYKVKGTVKFDRAERDDDVSSYLLCLSNSFNPNSNMQGCAMYQSDWSDTVLAQTVRPTSTTEIAIDLTDEQIRNYKYILMTSSAGIDVLQGPGVLVHEIGETANWYQIQNVHTDECLERVVDNDSETYDQLRVTACDAYNVEQRFKLVTNPLNDLDMYRIHALSDNKCISRSGAIGGDNFKLTSECWSNSEAVALEVKAKDPKKPTELKIARLATGGVHAWSCLSSNSNDNGPTSLWHNCNGGDDIVWKFRKAGHPDASTASQIADDN